METEGEFVFATSLDTKDTDQIAEFLEHSVKGEGTRSPPHPAALGRGLPAVCRDPALPCRIPPNPALLRPR